ncbi:MAG: TonB-dependent receptor [Saprospiraceae bacterium]|nr:TonB-dependent receptor [Saprospiraceae bacterium]
MHFKSIIALCSLLLSVLAGFAQNSATLSGSIKDQSTGETLIGATVRLQELPNTGATSNEYGFYSITAPVGNYTVLVQYIGYQSFTQKINLQGSLKLDVMLADGATLQEVTIQAEKKQEAVERPLMGVEKLSMAEIKTLPTLLGERDLVKTIQLLPGVKSAGEGNAGFYVRGGAADQNLILLDEAQVYNASHLLGFFSTFNADAIKDATLYKGGMPPQFGGRLSSVLDIKMNDGNNQRLGVSGGIGLISSKLNIETPIQKGKSSLLVTGRRTYADLFLRASSDTTLNNNTLYFYDLNAKMNYQLGAKDRLFVSGYFGRDKLGLGDEFGLNWGNATATLRWNHLFSDKLFSNTSLIFSNYNNNIRIQSGTNDFKISSQIRDYNFKQDFQWFPNSRNTWKYGLQVIHHTITPSSINASESSSFASLAAQKRFGLESAAYIAHEWQAQPRLKLLYGLRVSAFNVLGAGDFYTYDQEGNVLDTMVYQNGKIVKTYVNLEPRFALSYLISDRQSLKFGYNRNSQYLHLLSNSTSGNPTDLWMPTTNNVKPEIADQIALGYFHNFEGKGQFELSVETYYKSMQNQLDYRNGADVQGNSNVEGELLYGPGRAYGLELLLKKRSGRLTGWVGYTLARTERKIEGINKGAYYPAKQDRTHEISIVAMFQLSRRWALSGTWIYYTGNAVTFPSGKYSVNNATAYYYTERNAYRMPNYHRLDLGATFLARKTKRFESEWAFSAFNAYNRLNAYTITFRDSKTEPGTTEAVQTSLFGIVPSVSWNFKF